MNATTTTNIFVVHIYKKINPIGNKYLGVYSSKELADAAGKEHCETWGNDKLHYTVIISALDDIINGEPQ